MRLSLNQYTKFYSEITNSRFLYNLITIDIGIKPQIFFSTFVKANEQQSNPLRVCEEILIKPPSCLTMASKTNIFYSSKAKEGS